MISGTTFDLWHLVRYGNYSMLLELPHFCEQPVYYDFFTLLFFFATETVRLKYYFYVLLLSSSHSCVVFTSTNWVIFHTTTLKTMRVLNHVWPIKMTDLDSGLHVGEVSPSPFSKVSVFICPLENKALTNVSVFRSLHFQKGFESLHFRWKRLHPLIVYVWTEGQNG